MAEAASRGGVACRLGCTECCRGAFELTAADVLRLREGFRRLCERDAATAARLLARVDASTGGDDEFCPALDPETGACELYEARPVTCRTFGPATHTVEGGVAACERCYAGLSDAGIAARAVSPDPHGLEAALIAELKDKGHGGAASVAAALPLTETT